LALRLAKNGRAISLPALGGWFALLIEHQEPEVIDLDQTAAPFRLRNFGMKGSASGCLDSPASSVGTSDW
ncbi:MAG: hypothetical protein WCF74_17645, partial [Candidatus Sulfotelmatobacter sp.]